MPDTGPLAPNAAAQRRATFMANVRAALERPESGAPFVLPPRPPLVDALVRQVPADAGDLPARWMQLAAKNGLVVRRGTLQQVPALLDEFFANYALQNILLNIGGLAGSEVVAAHLQQQGRTLVRWGDADCSNAAFHCDAAITDCRYALADTGAVLVASDAAFGRSTTLVTSVHVLLVPVNRIVPDMVDGFAAIAKTGDLLPSNVVVINGPSKTSDIESNLVTGVHGPKFLYAIVLDA